MKHLKHLLLMAAVCSLLMLYDDIVAFIFTVDHKKQSWICKILDCEIWYLFVPVLCQVSMQKLTCCGTEKLFKKGTSEFPSQKPFSKSCRQISLSTYPISCD